MLVVVNDLVGQQGGCIVPSRKDALSAKILDEIIPIRHWIMIQSCREMNSLNLIVIFVCLAVTAGIGLCFLRQNRNVNIFKRNYFVSCREPFKPISAAQNVALSNRIAKLGITKAGQALPCRGKEVLVQ